MLRRVREENRKVIEEYEGKVLERMMEYEDLRSWCVTKYEELTKLNQTVQDLRDKLKTQKEENNALDVRIEKLET